MKTAIILIPALSGLLCFFLRDRRMLHGLLFAAAAAHSGLTALLWFAPQGAQQSWLQTDPLGLFFLSIVSLLNLLSAFYCTDYLNREAQRIEEEQQSRLFSNSPEQVFCSCLLFFLAAMTLAVLSQHLGLLWFGLEATTLASAPLIYFHRTGRSLEAMWKYLLICSVGIALALLGTFFLVVAANSGAGHSLLVRDLLSAPPHGAGLPWLKLAFIFMLAGYGTKAGLAPFHTWLPDAHSEAPSVVSALLSGGLLNCAFLAVLRGHQVCSAAGIGQFSGDLLIFFGLLSIAFALLFITRQQDYKRLLAYSSVEHIGIIAFGVGLGGLGAFGGLLHALNHSCAKALLFLTAGNILGVYRSKSTRDVFGVLNLMPISGWCWLIGFLAITGIPPFGLFISEFLIFKAALDGGRYEAAVLFAVLLALVFVAMAAILPSMAQGRLPKKSALSGYRRYILPGRLEPLPAVLPPIVLACILLVLGIYLPRWLTDAIKEAVNFAGVIGL